MVFKTKPVPSKETLQEISYLIGIVGEILKNSHGQEKTEDFKHFSELKEELTNKFREGRELYNNSLLKNAEVKRESASSGPASFEPAIELPTPKENVLKRSRVAITPHLSPNYAPGSDTRSSIETNKNCELDLEGANFDSVLKQLDAMLERYDLIYNLGEYVKPVIVINILKSAGIRSKADFIDMKNEQKAIIAFCFAILDARSKFLHNDKFVSTLKALKNSETKISPDTNFINEVIFNAPDIDLTDKIELFRKVKSLPPRNEEQALVYLLDHTRIKNNMAAIYALSDKYFLMLGGRSPMPYQFILSIGDYNNPNHSGLAGIPYGPGKGYFADKYASYKITDRILNIMSRDESFIKELDSLNLPFTYKITENLINSIPNDKLKLRNILVSIKNKEFKTKYEVEKIMANLMPAMSPTDQEDKKYFINLLTNTFLQQVFANSKNAVFTTKESFEKFYISAFPAIKNKTGIMDKIREYSVSSGNDVCVKINEDKDLTIYISVYGFGNNTADMLLTVDNIDVNFRLSASGIEPVDAIQSGIEFSDGFFRFDSKKFKGKYIFIKLQSNASSVGIIHISSNYELDNEVMNETLEDTYEPTKFIMNDKASANFMNAHRSDMTRLAALMKTPDAVNEFLINIYSDEDVDENDTRYMSFDKDCKSISIDGYIPNDFKLDVVFNVPPSPPYMALQIKTNQTLQFISQLSEGSRENLAALRAINSFKLLSDIYLKIVTPPERNVFRQKELTININDQKKHKTKVLQLLDLFTRLNYSNQIKI